MSVLLFIGPLPGMPLFSSRLPCVSGVSKQLFLNHWAELEVVILMRSGQRWENCPFSAWSYSSPIRGNLGALEQFLGVGYLRNGPSLSAHRRSWAASDPSKNWGSSLVQQERGHT